MQQLQSQAFPMRYAKNMAKPFAFKALQEQIKACRKCVDCKKCDTFQDTLWGNPNATLLIILSWPDASQDELDYLKTAINYYGIDPDVLAFTFASHCNGYINNKQRPPVRQEIEQCAAYTRQVIEIIEPLAILCLSTISSNLFYKQSLSDSIKEPSFIHNIPIFTTYPPSYILNLYYSNNSNYEAKHQEFYDKIKNALDYIEKQYPALVIYKED